MPHKHRRTLTWLKRKHFYLIGCPSHSPCLPLGRDHTVSLVKHCCRINRGEKKEKVPTTISPSPVGLIFLEPNRPAGRGIWQRTSDNPEESWHWKRQSLHRSRPDWKMHGTQRADETNQECQQGCTCRAGWAWNVWEGHCEHTLPHRG